MPSAAPLLLLDASASWHFGGERYEPGAQCLAASLEASLGQAFEASIRARPWARHARPAILLHASPLPSSAKRDDVASSRL